MFTHFVVAQAMATVKEASATPLDSSSLVVLRGDSWCCLLCERQFKSEQHLGRHLAGSSLHQKNLAAALSAGRIPSSAMPALETLLEAQPTASLVPAKRERSDVAASGWVVSGNAPRPPEESEPANDPPSPEPKPSAGSLSALEQMELFERRLQKDAKRKPKKVHHCHRWFTRATPLHTRSCVQIAMRAERTPKKSPGGTAALSARCPPPAGGLA